MQIIIVSGLSGAGKSLAIDAFEDVGYYCIDNLPLPLIKDFITLMKDGEHKLSKVVFVIDIRGGVFLDDIVKFKKTLTEHTINHKLLFLEATSKELLKRYAETRRQHPLAVGKTNEEAIEEEIQRLAPIKEMSDLIIDTSDLKRSELTQVLRNSIRESGQPEPFRFIVQSFGYKYGMPAEADFIFDVRFIANPFYITEMRHLTGQEETVRDYVLNHEDASFFIEEVFMLLKRLKPSYIREGKPSVSIAFGCTGGQHRSVVMAIELATKLSETDENVTIRHREI